MRVLLGRRAWLLGDAAAQAGDGGSAPSEPVAPTVNRAPSISYPAVIRVGDRLTAVAGSYVGLPMPTAERRWQYSEDGESWNTISGQTGLSLITTGEMEGAQVRFQERGVNSEGETAWQSTTPSPVIEPILTRPSFTLEPSIAPAGGLEGTTFTLSLGNYSGSAPITVTWTLTLNGADVSDDVDGTTYVSTGPGLLRLTVRLENEAGTRERSADATITAITVPSAPRNVAINEFDHESMSVIWATPASNGGAAVSDYAVRWRRVGGTWGAPMAGATSPQRIEALDASTTYEVQVMAGNSAGWGAWSVAIQQRTDEAPPEPIHGPIRPKTAIAGNVVMCGNSTFVSTEVPLSDLWDGAGTVYHEHGDWPYNFWSNDGPARNQSYNYLFMIENDLLDADGSDAGAETAIGYPDPSSPRGISGLELGYWIALEVADRNAELFLTVVGPNHAVDYDERNRAIMAFWVEWMRAHVPGLKVWLYDMPLIVEYLRAAGVPDNQIWAPNGSGGVDPLHYAERGAKAFAWGIYYLISGALPVGAATEDATVAQAVTAAVEASYWSGFGGAVGHEPFIDFDPLPYPSPRPGDPEPEPVAPTAPRNISFSGVSTDHFDVLWDAPLSDGGAQITEYEVAYRVGSDGSVSTIGGASSPQPITGLTANTTYQVRVRARNSVGWSEWSGWEAQVTNAPVVTVPNIPRSVGFENTTTSGFSVTWVAPADTGGAPILEYEIAWRVGADGAASSTRNVTSPHPLSGLDADTGYQVRLRARNSAGWGEWTTWTAHATAEPDPVEPGVPTAIAFQNVGETSFEVTWSPPASDGGAVITAYEVEYRLAPSGTATSIPGAASPQEIIGLTAGTAYDVRVRARNSVGWGPWAEWVQQETEAEDPGPDPDPAGNVEWTADSYSGPTRIGTLPVVADGIMTFTNRVAFEVENGGFYFCAALRGNFNGGNCILVFANPDPTNSGVDPYTSATVWGNSVALDRYPEGIGQGVGDLTANTWTVVEAWSLGDDIGARIGASASDEIVTDAPGPFGPTSHITVFDDLGHSIPFEVTALAIRLEMPTEQERADLRAWAAGLIPT